MKKDAKKNVKAISVEKSTVKQAPQSKGGIKMRTESMSLSERRKQAKFDAETAKKGLEQSLKNKKKFEEDNAKEIARVTEGAVKEGVHTIEQTVVKVTSDNMRTAAVSKEQQQINDLAAEVTKNDRFSETAKDPTVLKRIKIGVGDLKAYPDYPDFYEGRPMYYQGNKPDDCEVCEGRGTKASIAKGNLKEKCKVCEGTGKVFQWHKITNQKIIIDETGKAQAYSPQLVTFPPATMAIPPHQAVIDTVLKVKSGLKGNKPLFKEAEIHYGRGGAIMYLECVTEQQYTIEQGDDVLASLFIRNGYDGSTALGGDIGTRRIACMNGNMIKSQLGSFSIRHVGNAQKMMDAFNKTVPVALKAMTDYVEKLREMSRRKLTQKLIEHWVLDARIADKYLPDYVEVSPISEAEKKKLGDQYRNWKHKKVELKNDGKSMTMWNLMNDVTGGQPTTKGEYDRTKGLWHNKGMQIQQKALVLTRMNRTAFHILENKAKFSA